MSTDDNQLIDRVRNVAARTFKHRAEEIAAGAGMGSLEGWDSLGHLILMMEIEKEFKVRFSTVQIGQPKSVAEICQLLQSMPSNG